MKKSKKGFTLIELLAIIAMIGVLVTLIFFVTDRIFNEAVRKTLINQVKIFNQAASQGYSKTVISNMSPEDTVYVFSDKKMNQEEGNIEFKVTGGLPSSGAIKITSDGKIAIAISDGVYCAIKNFNEDEVSIYDKKTSECTFVDYSPSKCFITEWNEFPSDIQMRLDDYYYYGNENHDMGVSGKVIYSYNYDDPDCGTDIVIPSKIGGVIIEAIGHGAFEYTFSEESFYNNLINKDLASNFNNKLLVADSDNKFLSDLIAYDNLDKITSLVLPDTIKVIGENAFSGNNLYSLVLPDSVTTMGDQAFSENNLTNVTLSNSLTAINTEVFYNNNLSNITIPDSVTSIQEGAFRANNLTSLAVPDSVTEIGDAAFAANAISTLTMPDDLEYLGWSAFSSNQLTEVTIPSGLTSIESGVFNENQLTSIVIPNNITSIGERAFYLNQLETATIPNTVTSIGADAFSWNQLTSIVIPNNITTIENGTFSWNQIASITIPSTVTYIGREAFMKNRLQTVIVPNAVTYIGTKAFAYNYIPYGQAKIDNTSSSTVANLIATYDIFDKVFGWNTETGDVGIPPTYLR